MTYPAILIASVFLLAAFGVERLSRVLGLPAVIVLVALGYTMVYGILQLINFAHGEVLMIGALTSWSCIGMMQAAMPGAPGWHA